MTTTALQPDFDVKAYPTVTEAAAMMSVHKSTVSRKAEEIIGAGATKRLPAREVLRIANEQKQVPLTQVGGTLIEYARENAPDALKEVRTQVEEFFAADRSRKKPTVSREDFLAQARDLLDEAEFQKVAARYDATYGKRPGGHLVGNGSGRDA